MIMNERQLQNTKLKLRQFSEAIAVFNDEPSLTLDSLVAKAQEDALVQQIRELTKLVQEYEDLKEGRIGAFELDSLADLPIGLIKARIASNLTQRELAERLGLKEQQIQRYETELYQSCSFSRLVEIAGALNLIITERIQVQNLADSLPDVLRRLNSVGLDTAFIKNRIDRNLEVEGATGERLLARAAMMFDWNPSELRQDQVPDLPGLGAAMARFKMPRGRDARSVAAYTAYAHKLASICAKASQQLPSKLVSTNWKIFRQSVVEAHGKFDLASVSHYAWDCGVVVLPLNDSGAFHGATWRFQGRNVVVVKQRTQFASRWLSDLVHELYHAGEEPEKAEFEVIELPETSDERRELPSEQKATRFSSEAILNGRAEELTQLCVKKANHFVPKLKEIVKNVAEKESVNLGVLANYIAYRLSMEGVNWWGTAANLQNDTASPLDTMRDVFFERFNFENLSDDEYEVLSLSLSDGATK
jgi:transcriptional regulator with XRE-family HTH domain